jgi:hypothetical protein
MSVISIDPGTNFCGVAVWEPLAQGRETGRLIACFPIIAPSDSHYRMAFRRIVHIYDRLAEKLDALDLGAGPHTLVAEHLVGHGVPPDAALDLLVITLRQFAGERGYTFLEVAPHTWREVAVLRGDAGAGYTAKEAVKWALEAKLPQLRGLANEPGGMDALEAAGIGLWYCDRLRLMGRMGAGAVGVMPGRRPARKRGA